MEPVLPPLVARLLHAHHLAVRRRRLPVHLPDAVVVPRAQAGDEHGLGPGPRTWAAGPRDGWRAAGVQHHPRQEVFLRRARQDLVQDPLQRPVAIEHPYLDAEPLVGLSKVRVVEPRDHAPDLVGRVEQVPREEVELGVLVPREQPVQLVPVRRVEEDPRGDLLVRAQNDPLRAAQERRLAVVVAVREQVLRRRVVVEVDVHEPQPGDGAAPVHQHVPVRLRRRLVQVAEAAAVEQREVGGQRPRRARERLAEEERQRVAAAAVHEEHAAHQQRVEEGRGGREHPVAEDPVRDDHEVTAAFDVVVGWRCCLPAAGPEPLGRSGVRRRARAAPPLLRLMLPQPLDEIACGR